MGSAGIIGAGRTRSVERGDWGAVEKRGESGWRYISRSAEERAWRAKWHPSCCNCMKSRDESQYLGW